MTDVVRALSVLILLVATGGGCDVSSYRIGGGGGGGGGDDGDDTPGDGGVDDDGGGGGGIDAGPPADACLPSLERCNHADDDCDGAIDETFNLDQDPANCGDCGVTCNDATGSLAGTCGSGTCEFTCLPGHLDLDPGVPGCEYTCTQTSGGVEACDFADNDCDGDVDEEFNTISDVDNCGGCGRVCTVLHATAACVDLGGDGDGDCTYSTCDAGFADLVPGVPGCEYQCPVVPARAETCNFVDDDCDGVIDDGAIAGAGVDCTMPGFEALGDTGYCDFGTTACLAGSIVCAGYTGPRSDNASGQEYACNDTGVDDLGDDDCDGQIDEGYLLASDPHNCGDCGVDCTLPGVVPNAIPSCGGGSCGYVACLPGYADLDPIMPGCDYLCTKTGEADVCDGRDNDCDGDTDDEVTLPGAGYCETAGACSGAGPQCAFDACTGRTRIHCAYGAGVELDPATCDVVFQETRCDGVDSDCDNDVDESFPAAHDELECDDGDVGGCRRVGAYACNIAGDGVVCDFSGSPPDVGPTAEVCNGINDDCDTDGTGLELIDEGAPDDLLDITSSAGAVLFRIYRYEASRPDANAGDAGAMDHRACSKPLALPWASVSQTDAAAACADAGLRLCTAAEWQLACEGLGSDGAGPDVNIYPYGDIYDPDACNGNDYDPGCVSPDDDRSFPAGSPYGCPAPPPSSLCVSQYGAFDLSGNLKEWTSTEIQPGAFNVRGGAFDSAAGGLSCRFDFVSMDPDFAFPNLGFRCCEDFP